MPLATGTRLGPYEVQGPLGAGGMGEVYRARDTRLDRSVAIKVIPSHLAAEAEVRQRFEREARAVSALNHPNICVLHDVGHEGSTHFFVMELLEGETLAARLEKGPLGPDEFFPIAVQVADALAAAHRAGIVHRDLKPGNIVLTRSGAKLLDFGLARATGLAATPGSGLTQSPTLTRPLTAEGTIVGTFQYMAPEQLEGRDADARTDLFAFGAVLYEMATGKRAFEGESQASLIAAIIKETPRPISELMPMSPPALDHVVRGCLAKRPDDRWQNASDVKRQLEWIRDAGSQAGVPAPVLVHRRHLNRALWIVSIAATVATLALGSYIVTRHATKDAVRFAILPPTQQTFDPSQNTVAVSPDGKTIAFVAYDTTGAARIYLRPLGSFEANPLVTAPDVAGLFWSPDSRYIGFFSESKLKRVAISGGGMQVLADAQNPRGASWGANGDIVFQGTANGPLVRVRTTGGEVHAVTAIDTTAAEDAHRFPWFLPDGEHFLFAVLPAIDGMFNVKVGSLDGKTSGPIVRSGSAAVYANGYLIYSRDNQLVAQRFDADSFKLDGDPVPLGEVAGSSGGWTGAPGACVSLNGVLVHAAREFANTELTRIDRTGRRIGRLSLPAGGWQDGAFSPDGSRYVVAEWHGADTSDLWMIDTVRNLSTRFSFEAGTNYDAIWTPDGKNVVFVSGREGREQIYIKPANSATEEKRLFEGDALFCKTEAMSPDGRWLLYSQLAGQNRTDLFMHPMEGGESRILLKTPFYEADASVSPDGRWMMYRSDETGRPEMYVRSFPEMGEKFRISDDALGASANWNTFFSAWRRDGREVVYDGADGRTVVSVAVTTGASFDASSPRTLFRRPPNVSYTSMSPSGESFMLCGPDNSVPTVHTVVLNWPSLLVHD